MGQDREKLEQLATRDPLPFLEDTDATIRRLAISAAAPLDGEAVTAAITKCLSDSNEHVRAEAVEVLAHRGIDVALVEPALHDPADRVAEAAATALGELADPAAVEALMHTAENHQSPLVREAAVAALGAIGDPMAMPLLLELVRSAKPQIRRRTVVALTAFEGAEVQAALEQARLDRNPMVREVAEMLLGREAT